MKMTKEEILQKIEKKNREIERNNKQCDEIKLKLFHGPIDKRIDQLEEELIQAEQRKMISEKYKAKLLAQIGEITPEELKMIEMKSDVFLKYVVGDNPYDWDWKSEPEIFANKEVMYYLASHKKTDSSLIKYVSEELQNDYGFVTLLIINSDNINTWYSEENINGSNLAIGSSIGINIRSNPMFWTTLNTRIRNLDANRYKRAVDPNYPLFDVEKEFQLVQHELSKQFSTSIDGNKKRP